MIYTIYLLLFIVSTVLIFIVNNIYYLICFTLFQIILIVYYKIKLKELLKLLKSNLVFLLIVLICNIIFMSVYSGILLFIKLLIVILSTYINKYVITNERLIKSIEHIFFFVKDKEVIYLIITMSLSFIPILNKMILSISLNLRARNFTFNLKNIITKGHLIFIAFINQIIKKTNDMELTLINRGFER